MNVQFSVLLHIVYIKIHPSQDSYSTKLVSYLKYLTMRNKESSTLTLSVHYEPLNGSIVLLQTSWFYEFHDSRNVMGNKHNSQ